MKRPSVFLSYAFRSMFFFAGLYGVGSISWWVSIYFFGIGTPPISMDSISWHGHEMVFGFLIPCIIGFLLTAVGSWAKRPPVSGSPLAFLVLFLVAGRLGVNFSYYINPFILMILDSSFLTWACFLFGKEVILGKDQRNYKLIVLIFCLLLANIVFHLEITQSLEFPPRSGLRISIVLVMTILMTIAGRIIPNFTKNWLLKKNGEETDLPVAFNHYDKIVMITTTLFLLRWIWEPRDTWTGYFALIIGMMHLFRLKRWKGLKTVQDPFIFVLHVGYMWIVLSFFIIGISNLWGVLVFGSIIHSLTLGSFSLLIVAVGSRAALGHTGRELKIGNSMRVSYLLILLAAIFRISANGARFYNELIIMSAIFWVLGFGIFLFIYFPVLTKPSLK
ncbi:MAG: NnrS family protein [Deltaproteobacteria bacterium]|jgi:uncharacterized protein involved in response to NO|nr:NnrS family protein [Deltaproteobacteria bacterium]